MNKERLEILNNKGQKLAVYLFKNTTSQLVLMIPGLDPYDDIPGMEKVFKKYYSLGNSICYFDATGFGKSEGKKEIDLAQRVEDIGSILQIMSAKYRKIILYGPSLAAIPAIISSVKFKDKNIIKLININGLFYLDKHLTILQRSRILLYFALNRHTGKQKKYIKANFHPDKIQVPTLIIYGEKDPIINPEQSRKIYEELKTKKELLVIPNGEHLLLNDEYVQYSQRLFNWLSQS